ncbi:MAG: transposase, partial [Deltaproteobacteria bacterium]|nr:transposase [Deltaproteobacteria bacterium]
MTARGNERRRIFEDTKDRKEFLARLGEVLSGTETICYAWTLVPNHFHLLLRTGTQPMATVMRRLLTGYAISFNRRHRRYGHLFQNRYKSILFAILNFLLKNQEANPRLPIKL